MMISVHTTCPVGGESAELQVDEAGYAAWKAGALIQNALPDLDPDAREQLMTGICPPCWTVMFAEEA